MVIHLQSVDLLRHCSAEQVLRLANIARPCRFDHGQEIYTYGHPPSHLYCLVEGSVRAVAVTGSSRVVVPPETFGVREILADESRAESAVAAEDVLALAFEAGDFFDLLSNNIDIVKALFRQMLADPAAREASRDAAGDPVATTLPLKAWGGVGA